MKKSISLSFALLIGIKCFSQLTGNYDAGYRQHDGYQKQTVIAPNQASALSAEILINLEADSYLAIFSATQYGPNATATDSLMEIRLSYVKAELEKVGITGKDFHFDMISFVPTFANTLEVKKMSKTYNEVPVGFQMKKNIHILFRDQVVMEKIISAMATSEIYDLVKVEYNSTKLKDSYKLLREKAIELLNEKKADLEKMGFHAENMNFTEGHEIFYPENRYNSYQAYHYVNTITADKDRLEVMKANPDNFKSPGSIGSQTNIFLPGSNVKLGEPVKPKKALEPTTVTYTEKQLKETTRFFNKLEPERFDQIIGGNIASPTIQIAYKLTLNCSLETLDQFTKRKQAEADALALKQVTKKRKRK